VETRVADSVLRFLLGVACLVRGLYLRDVPAGLTEAGQ
jgi:hypothetical protein